MSWHIFNYIGVHYELAHSQYHSSWAALEQASIDCILKGLLLCPRLFCCGSFDRSLCMFVLMNTGAYNFI